MVLTHKQLACEEYVEIMCKYMGDKLHTMLGFQKVGYKAKKISIWLTKVLPIWFKEKKLPVHI